jgi:hypothetical protein
VNAVGVGIVVLPFIIGIYLWIRRIKQIAVRAKNARGKSPKGW